MRIEKDQVVSLGVAALLLALFVGGVLVPLRYQRAEYERRIAEAQDQLGIDLKDANMLARLHAEVVQLRRHVREASHYVPQDDEISDVLRGLSESLDAFGIVERDMVTGATKTFPDCRVIPIELRFKASYPSTHGVLQLIERMARLMRIDEVKVRGRANRPGELLDVHLSLSTFIARTGGAAAE